MTHQILPVLATFQKIMSMSLMKVAVLLFILFAVCKITYRAFQAWRAQTAEEMTQIFDIKSELALIKSSAILAMFFWIFVASTLTVCNALHDITISEAQSVKVKEIIFSKEHKDRLNYSPEEERSFWEIGRAHV